VGSVARVVHTRPEGGKGPDSGGNGVNIFLGYQQDSWGKQSKDNGLTDSRQEKEENELVQSEIGQIEQEAKDITRFHADCEGKRRGGP